MRRLAALLMLSLALAACAGAESPRRPLPARHHTADGIAYGVPSGLHAAGRTLTPHLTAPHEVLTVGSGALPAGGACAQFPSAALAAMRRRDVLVTVQERAGRATAFPARPARFTLPAGARLGEAQLCAGRHASFTSSWFGFRDGGRAFHVLVAIGRSASRARVRNVLAVLDSLRIARRRPVRLDPDDAIAFDDVERGLHLVHPSAWRLYRGALAQGVKARDQLALGTFRLDQRRPDRSCSPTTALRQRRPSDGLIDMFEYRGLNPRQLARFPRRPARLRLPRSSHGTFECFGASWSVTFQDAGRAFQVHVYGPPRRRREALAILDSLRVDRRARVLGA